MIISRFYLIIFVILGANDAEEDGSDNGFKTIDNGGERLLLL